MNYKDSDLYKDDLNLLMTFVKETVNKLGAAQGMEVVDDYISNNKFDRIPTDNNLRAIIVNELGINNAKKVTFFLFNGEYSKEKLYKLFLKSDPIFNKKKDIFDTACCNTFNKYGNVQLRGAIGYALSGVYKGFTNDKKDRELLFSYIEKEDVKNIVSSIFDDNYLENIEYDPNIMADMYSKHIISSFELEKEQNKEY